MADSVRAAHAAQRSKRKPRAAAYSAALRARLGKSVLIICYMVPRSAGLNQTQTYHGEQDESNKPARDQQEAADKRLIRGDRFFVALLHENDHLGIAHPGRTGEPASRKLRVAVPGDGIDIIIVGRKGRGTAGGAQLRLFAGERNWPWSIRRKGNGLL